MDYVKVGLWQDTQLTIKMVLKENVVVAEKNLYINKNNIDDAIYYDKKTYHSSCFINICQKRIANKRADVSAKWTWVYDHIDSIKKIHIRISQ